MRVFRYSPLNRIVNKSVNGQKPSILFSGVPQSHTLCISFLGYFIVI
jgi:hypothetical protein